MKCPDCGREVHPRGLGSHRGGGECYVRGERRRLLREGYVRSDSVCLEPVAKQATTAFQQGYIGRRNKRISQSWVPRWARGLAEIKPEAERHRLIAAAAAGDDDATIALGYLLFRNLPPATLERLLEDTEKC